MSNELGANYFLPLFPLFPLSPSPCLSPLPPLNNNYELCIYGCRGL